MTAEQNYRLLQELDANRHFMLLAYRDNPALLAQAEERIRELFSPSGIEVKHEPGPLPGPPSRFS